MMYKKSGFKVKKNMFKIRLFNNFLAEEPEDTKEKEVVTESENDDNDTKDTKDTTESNKQTTINYEDLISKARQEEKGKLYPEIKQLKKEKEGLVEKNNNNLLTIEEKDRKIKELEEQLSNSEKTDNVQVKELKATIKDLQNQIKTLESSKVDVDEIEKNIKEQYEVKLYRLEKINSEGSDLIPELVMGTTKEEIDTSIENSKQRFNEIQENIMKKNNTQKVPSVNVDMSKFDTKDFSMEDIARMDVTSPEYQEMRRKMGLR